MKPVIIKYIEKLRSLVAQVTFQRLSGHMWLRMAIITREFWGMTRLQSAVPQGQGEAHSRSFLCVCWEGDRERERKLREKRKKVLEAPSG